MKAKRYFTVFYTFLAFVLNVFLVSSCRTGTASTSAPEPEIDGGIPLKQTVLVLHLEEGQDIIMSSYMDPELRDLVLAFFEDITGFHDVAAVVLSNAAAFDIPPALAFALCAEESAYNPRAFNRNLNETVDRGLFQLNSESFPKLTAEEFYDPGINARYGLSHLRWCLDHAGTEVAALAMYNAGMTRVRSAGTPKSTLDYISRILKRQRQIEELFLAEYARIVRTESIEEPEKASFRLSLLTPLGR